MLASMVLVIGPFLASGACWSSLAGFESLGRKNASLASDRLLLFTSLFGAGVGVSFVKLVRITGVFGAVVATGIVVGTVAMGISLLLSAMTMGRLTITSTVLYALSVAILLFWGRRLPKHLFALLCAILFYYSTVLGPFLVSAYLDERKIINLPALGELVMLAGLLPGSAILMIVSSYIVDRLSHEPQ
jgi:hypothetical protein